MDMSIGPKKGQRKSVDLLTQRMEAGEKAACNPRSHLG
jgi:hypothetical protein